MIVRHAHRRPVAVHVGAARCAYLGLLCVFVAVARAATPDYAALASTNLAQFSDADLAVFIPAFRTAEPEVRKRVEHYCEQSLGQRFAVNAPRLALDRCDCVTFVERIYALALADSRDRYLQLRDRLRQKNGVSGYLNRNFFTEADWIPSNAWLFDDLTCSLGGGSPWLPMHHVVRRTPFFARLGYVVDLPDEKVIDAYLPTAALPSVLSDLCSGDLAFLVRGGLGEQSTVHWGVIIVDSGAAPLEQRVQFACAAAPFSRIQPFGAALANQPGAVGFKILRLRPQAENLAVQALGQNAVVVPAGARLNHAAAPAAPALSTISLDRGRPSPLARRLAACALGQFQRRDAFTGCAPAECIERLCAQALAADDASAGQLEQELRYRDGVANDSLRNTNLAADWVLNNGWLFDDISMLVGARRAWIPLHQILRSAAGQPRKFIGAFIPRIYMHWVLEDIEDGDLALIVIGDEQDQSANELGILHRDDADRVRILHVEDGAPRDELLLELGGLADRRTDILGFKFLRLRTDAVARLAERTTRAAAAGSGD